MMNISEKEQQAVRFRYVDKYLVPCKEFIGLCEVSMTTGKNPKHIWLVNIMEHRTLEEYNPPDCPSKVKPTT